MKYLLEMLVIHWVFSHNFNPFNNQLSARWEIITKIRHLMRPLRARWPVRSRSPTRGTDTAGSIDFYGTRFSFIMIEIMVQLDDRWSNEVQWGLEMPFINTVSKLTEVRINIAFPRLLFPWTEVGSWLNLVVGTSVFRIRNTNVENGYDRPFSGRNYVNQGT